MPEIPYDPRDLFRFSLRERLLFDGLVTLARATGWWRYPAAREGDLARMRLLDKVYWLYKAQHPIQRAHRGSGLEARFAAHAKHRWALPPAFTAEQELTLSAAGDIFCHPYLERSQGQLYEAVAEVLFGADVSMANLECLIAPDQRGELSMTASSSARLFLDRDAWHALRGHGARRYDFLATANNHNLDLDAGGLDRSLDILDADGIAHHGANRAEEDATRATVIERRGVRLGVISWTFGLNAHRPPSERPSIVNSAPLNDGPERIRFDSIDAQIRDAERRGCDLVIAQLHWGMEHERYPTPRQVELAHALAERGVDVILGHHPHLPQPMEAYRTARDRDRVVPIFYSLGNLTCAFRAPSLCHGGLARLRVARGTSRDGRRRTYVAGAWLEGVRQVTDAATRKVRLCATGPLDPTDR